MNRPEALDSVRRCLPSGWSPAASPVVDRLYSLVVGSGGPGLAIRRYSLLYGDAERLVRTMDVDEALATLERDLEHVVAAHSPRRHFLHAGVVAWRGRAIVIPGRTLSGKSTLVAALVREGAAYYSDEYAVLDRQGQVHPYLRPLALREDGAAAPATRYPVEALGGRAGRRPVPVGLVVATRYRAGARWRPRELSPGEGMLALLAHAVSARRAPADTLASLRRLVAGARVVTGARGEAKEAAQAILVLAESTRRDTSRERRA